MSDIIADVCLTAIPDGLSPMHRDNEIMRIMESGMAAGRVLAVYTNQPTAPAVMDTATAWGYRLAAWVVRVLGAEREAFDTWPVMHGHLFVFVPEGVREWYFLPEDGVSGDVWQCDHTQTPPADFWMRVLEAYCPPGGTVATITTADTAHTLQVKRAVKETERRLHVIGG